MVDAGTAKALGLLVLALELQKVHGTRMAAAFLDDHQIRIEIALVLLATPKNEWMMPVDSMQKIHIN